MEKLDFTPDEYIAYRIDKGLGWPPKSRLDVITELVAEARLRYPEAYERAKNAWAKS